MWPGEAVWLALLVAVPVAFVPWLAHPIELPKVVLLRAGALALLGAATWQAGHPRTWPRNLATDPPIILAIALASAVLAATVLGIDPIRSLLGSLERSAGATTWLAYLILFASIAAWCPGNAGRRAIRQAALVGAAPVALYGLVQAVGADPWAWWGDASSPVGSTLGRSNFLGDLTAMLLPLALSVLVTARDRRARGASAALIALYGLVLVTTSARAAWLGAAVGCGLFFLAWSRRSGWRTGFRRTLAVALIAGLLACLLAAVLLVAQPEPPHPLAMRIQSLFGWDPSSPGTRLTVWRWSGPRIAARPVLGYGPDAAGLAFPTLWRGARVDRAHNLVLDLTLEFGLVGLGFYLAIVASALRRARRVLRTAARDEAALLLGSLCALAAFWTATMFSFGVVTTWLLHWVLLGLLAGCSDSDHGRDLAPTSDRAEPWGAEDRSVTGEREDRHSQGTAGIIRRSPLPAPAVVGLVVAGLVAQIPLLAADAYAHRANVLAAVGHPGAVEAAGRAVALAPSRPQYRIALARSLVDQARPLAPLGAGAERETWLFRASFQARAATDRAPRDAYVWLAAAEVHRAAGALAGDADALDSAVACFRQARSLDHRLAEAESGWGLTELLRGDAEAAVLHYEAAIAIDESDARTYLRLGEALLSLARNHEAADAFARAVGNDPELAAAWVGHGRALCRVGKREEALAKIEHALELAPDDGPARQALSECLSTQR